jgi:hypothetical protein
MFLVVLSPNWLSRPFCLREYELFRRRWANESDMEVQRRIIVVSKRHVDDADRPPLLRDQDSFRFYARGEPNSIAAQDEFYGQKGPKDDRYWKLVERLAGQLLRSCGHIGRKQPKRELNGRTVYVARPAGDMRREYDRVVDSLTGAGYRVVPEFELSPDSIAEAQSAITKALAEAEVSIHLLGKSAGFGPGGASTGIVPLQLAEAKQRVPATVIDNAENRTGFHRIIFAPRILNISNETPESDPREPMTVLNEFGGHVAGDCVKGETISAFVEFIGQHLTRIAQAAPPPPPLPDVAGEMKVYLYYPPKDAKYAHNVAKFLAKRNIIPLTPAWDDDEAEKNKLDQQCIRDCDSVVLCWVSASEVWAKANSYKLLDWKSLGRTKPFARRGLVAGPPPGDVKAMFADLTPQNGVDVVIDWSESDPKPDDLNRLFS